MMLQSTLMKFNSSHDFLFVVLHPVVALIFMHEHTVGEDDVEVVCANNF